MNKTIICATASVLLVSGVTTARAGPADPVMVVKVGGLDLQSTSGAAAAMARINNASAVFCQGSNNPREMGFYADTLRCRREMAEKAVRKLDVPRVTALYNGSSQIRFAHR